MIAGKLLAVGNKLLDGVPDAAGDIRISVQLLIKDKLKEQRQVSASQDTIKRLEVEMKALTQLATRCVRVLDPVDPAEEAKPEPKPFGYEFNEDGTFFDADGDADGGRDEEEAELVREQENAPINGEWSFGDLDGADHDDLGEEYQPEDFFPTPSTIRLDLEDESEEESYSIKLDGTPEPFGLDFEDDDIETHRVQHFDSTVVQEVKAEVIIKKKESWSWPATMPNKKQHPISLMEDLESYGYRLNAEGTVWIAPPRMKKVAAVKPPPPVVVKKEESGLDAVKAEDAEEAEHEPEPFGYRFNDDGTFYGH